LWASEWAWRRAETNLHCVRSSGICNQIPISAFIRTDRRSDGQTDMARSTRVVILIKSIYTLWGRKRFILPVTYCPTNLVYPFTLFCILSDEPSIPFYSTSNGNIYTLWGRKRFLLPVTCFSTNLVYPFTLRVTGINILYGVGNASFCLLHTFYILCGVGNASFCLLHTFRYIFIGSETLPSACYILSDDSTLMEMLL